MTQELAGLLALAREARMLRLLATIGFVGMGPLGLIGLAFSSVSLAESLLPEETPDDKRRKQLKVIFGETEGEARFHQEWLERTIEVDLNRRAA